MPDEPEPVSDETRAAEARDAARVHAPDRPPSPDEEARAEEQHVDENVRAHYEDMAERGANQRGEGRVP
jgi:hypothetical protein